MVVVGEQLAMFPERPKERLKPARYAQPVNVGLEELCRDHRYVERALRVVRQLCDVHVKLITVQRVAEQANCSTSDARAALALSTADGVQWTYWSPADQGYIPGRKKKR